jgi:hypothetical protein
MKLTFFPLVFFASVACSSTGGATAAGGALPAEASTPPSASVLAFVEARVPGLLD